MWISYPVKYLIENKKKTNKKKIKINIPNRNCWNRSGQTGPNTEYLCSYAVAVDDDDVVDVDVDAILKIS